MSQKRSVRSLADALGISKSTLFKMKKINWIQKLILPKSIAIKLLLTADHHKLKQVMYAIDKVDPPSIKRISQIV
jgi:hypothetical protein